MTSRFVITVVVVTCFVAGAAAAGTVEENKALVSDFIAADNSRDFKSLPTFIAEDFKRHSKATPNLVIANRDQFIEHMRDGVEFFSGTKYYVQQMIAEGDRVAVWANLRGGVAGKGAAPQIDIEVSMVVRVEGDEIAELWVMWDNNALRSQLASGGNVLKN